MEALEKWFLTAKERGNPATDIDRRREGGAAWTRGNRAEVLVDGSTYFQRLYEQLSNLKRGDLMYFTDWRGDPDELLDGPGTELGKVLADLARKGVKLRGLVWRTHPHQEKFS